MFLEDKKLQVDADSSNIFLFFNLFLSYIHSSNGLAENTDSNKSVSLTTHIQNPFLEKTALKIAGKQADSLSLGQHTCNSSLSMQSIIPASVIH